MLRVLVIEDERLFRESLVRRIERIAGMQVVATAENGIEGLLQVAQAQPDVILSDIRMPGMDGIVFLEQLRKDYGRALVVFISGYPEFSNVRRALQLGAFDYLTKPLEDEELRRVADRLLAYGAGQQLNEAETDMEARDPVSWSGTVQGWIKQHIRDASLQGAADYAGMNAAAFSRKFSSQCGVTFTQYLTEVRLDRAKELLVATSRRVNDIAAELGLFDQRYFSEMFKRHVGCTPQEFRKKKE